MGLQILELKDQNCLFTFVISTLLGETVFKLFALLSFGFKLGICVLLFVVESSLLLLDVALVVFPVNLNSLVVALDSSFQLIGEVRCLLLGKDDLLVLKSPFSFILDSFLSKFVFLVLKSLLELLVLLHHLRLFYGEFIPYC